MEIINLKKTLYKLILKDLEDHKRWFIFEKEEKELSMSYYLSGLRFHTKDLKMSIKINKFLFYTVLVFVDGNEIKYKWFKAWRIAKKFSKMIANHNQRVKISKNN